MNEQKQQPIEQPKAGEQKRAYTQPKLLKHGNVETLTQIQVIGPSGPIYG